MSDFFDLVKNYAAKAKDETAKVAKTIWGKTGEFVDQTKLSMAITDAQRKIDDMYKQIGRLVYGDYKDGDEFATEVNECCEKIVSMEEEIASLKNEMSKLKDLVVCRCGQHNDKNAIYCSRCGEKLLATADEDEQVVVIKPTVGE